MGHQAHLMAPSPQALDEQINDAFNAPIEGGGYGQFGVGGE